MKLIDSNGVIEMNNESNLTRLFQKYDDIQLVYLFGSTTRNKENRLSDIDIAIQVKDSMSKKDRFQLQLQLISELSSILATDKLDLIIMNEASISLNFEIIKANHPIFIRDRSQKIEFEHKILSKYLDRRYYDKRYAVEFMDKISKKGLSF